MPLFRRVGADPLRSFRAAVSALLLLAVSAYGTPVFTATLSATASADGEPVRTAYVGQTLRLVLDFEDEAELDRISLSGMPSPSWSEASEFSEYRREPRTENGNVLNRRRFACDLLLLRPGEFTFRPAFTALAVTRVRSNPLFTQQFARDTGGETEAPLSLRVLPLPKPAAEGFCGLVGTYGLSADLSPRDASPGDLVNLVYTVKGLVREGSFVPPAPPEIPGVKVYPAKTSVGGDAVTVTHVLVPEDLSATNLPPVELSVFDPLSGGYTRLSAPVPPLSLRPREASRTDISDYLPEEKERTPGREPAGAAAKNGGTRGPDAASAPAPPRAGDTATLRASAPSYLAPSLRSKKLRPVPGGTEVTVVEEAKGFLRVVPRDGSSGSVWIQAESLREEPDGDTVAKDPPLS